MTPDSPAHTVDIDTSLPENPPFDPETQQSLSEIADCFDSMDRPSILQYQVDPLVAEILLEELRTEQMYDHVVDGELRHRAWRLVDTASETIIEITTVDDNGDERTHYAKPPAGEAFMDVRWWALNCHVNNRDFVIDHVRNKELNDILHASPPEWSEAISTLLYDNLGTANLALETN